MRPYASFPSRDHKEAVREWKKLSLYDSMEGVRDAGVQYPYSWGNPNEGNRTPRCLSDLNLEKHMIGMFVTPPEVFRLTSSVLPVELAIVAVLLSQIDAIGLVFLVVPSVVIAMVSVVVPPIVMVIVGIESYRNEEAGTQQKNAQVSMHLVLFSLQTDLADGRNSGRA
jgi:hypothetical protein